MRALTRWHRDECGSITLWMTGFVVLVLAIGGISVDLWRAQAERRSLAGAADAAAFAGASGIDAVVFRSSGVLQLDPAMAEALARVDLAGQDEAGRLTATSVVATPREVTVTLEGRVDLTLLGLLAPGYDPLPVRVTATAEPRLVP
ncbi:MAG: pilus assembly protein TadG-related protein [Nitriliruptorales bacterium]|nr:pilus assembly protein TadG-related protein [Nitriliruptorales bacterium]